MSYTYSRDLEWCKKKHHCPSDDQQLQESAQAARVRCEQDAYQKFIKCLDTAGFDVDYVNKFLDQAERDEQKARERADQLKQQDKELEEKIKYHF